MSIDSARYGSLNNWISTGDSAVISSNHFRNCSAILGVGLRGVAKPGSVISPLRQLPGNGEFIVMFPDYGGKKGSVIINPTAGDEQGFIYFKLSPGKGIGPVGSTGWLDNQIPGCISVNSGTDCLPTLLDTGNPDIQIFSNEFVKNQSVPSLSYISLSVGNPHDSAFIKTDFTVGEHRERGKDFVYLCNTEKEPKNTFGIRFFFEFDVLYDQQNGIIGIRKKLHKK
jgi:hypothetical protein